MAYRSPAWQVGSLPCLNPSYTEQQGHTEWAQLRALIAFLVFGVSLLVLGVSRFSSSLSNLRSQFVSFHILKHWKSVMLHLIFLSENILRNSTWTLSKRVDPHPWQNYKHVMNMFWVKTAGKKKSLIVGCTGWVRNRAFYTLPFFSLLKQTLPLPSWK